MGCSSIPLPVGGLGTKTPQWGSIPVEEGSSRGLAFGGGASGTQLVDVVVWGCGDGTHKETSTLGAYADSTAVLQHPRVKP